MGVAAAAFEAACEAALDIHDLALTWTIRAIGGELIVRSIVGKPALWKRPAPADYIPGNYRSNWNYGADRPDLTVTEATNITVVNGLGNIPTRASEHNHYLTNSTAHARPLEFGHSTQGRAVAGLTALGFDSHHRAALARAKAAAGVR